LLVPGRELAGFAPAFEFAYLALKHGKLGQKRLGLSTEFVVALGELGKKIRLGVDGRIGHVRLDLGLLGQGPLQLRLQGREAFLPGP